MSIRKTVIGVVASLLVAGGAYTGYWFYARETAARLLDDWTAQRRADGYEIAYKPPEFGGYPLLVRAVLGAPSISRDSFSWRGERMDIEFQPWNFRRVRVDLEGKQWMTLPDEKPTIIVEPAIAAIVARFSETGRMSDANVLLRDLKISETGTESAVRVAELWLEAAAPARPPHNHTDKNFDLSLSAADIVLPKGADGPLGRSVSRVRADMQLLGVVPGGELDRALEAWRRSGGTVDVDWLQVNWGDLDVRAKGTLALDAQSRPMGALSTNIRGHLKAIDALAARSMLDRNSATMAKIALSLLAKTPPEGGAPVLSVPVTAQDGHLYAGPLKLLDLAPIRFAAPPR